MAVKTTFVEIRDDEGVSFAEAVNWALQQNGIMTDINNQAGTTGKKLIDIKYSTSETDGVIVYTALIIYRG